MKMHDHKNIKLIRVLLLLISLSSIIIVFLLFGSQSASNDGEIISKELVKVPGQNPKLNIYKIFYYSEGTKVEALLTEPIWSGEYPMVVSLHGGLIFGDESSSHYDFGYTVEGVSKGSKLVITLYPNYRGYLESEGHPQGLAGSTLDAQNAIKAAKSLLGNKIKANSTYLLGYSLGGGIALKMASELQDVKAVAVVGSYVGADEVVRWLEENPTNISLVISNYRRDIDKYRNEAQNNHDSLLDRIPHIQAPVLFLQGKMDDRVMWQTVQQFADDMEKESKTVKLVMYPNGNHELDDQYLQQRDQEIEQWFKNYGLPKNW